MKTMMVNLSEAKARLSQYARLVKSGQRIILCDRNKPFAEIRPLKLTEGGRRPFGLGKGRIRVPDNFNDPDPLIDACLVETPIRDVSARYVCSPVVFRGQPENPRGLARLADQHRERRVAE